MTVCEWSSTAVWSLLAERLGLDVRAGRAPDFERRLDRACRVVGAPDPRRLFDLLSAAGTDGPAWLAAVDAFTVGETYFFRDRGCFAALDETILPALIEQRRRNGSKRLRFWSAGCSTGEEPYSIAMLLARHLPDLEDWSVTVTATDVNPCALLTARRGLYREWALRETPTWARDRYFRAAGPGMFQLADEIRRLVRFQPLNLVSDGYPAAVSNTLAMDVVFCRNVIMYFSPDVQRRVIGRLRVALVQGGLLTVSAAEAWADLLRPLEPVRFPAACFFRNVVHAVSVPAARPVPPTQPRRRVQRERQTVESVPAPLDLARLQAGRGDLDGACQSCQRALTRNRLDVDVYLLLAAVEQERGDLAAALDASRAAIYLDPDCAPAHFLLGSVLFCRGETLRARESMRIVVSLLRERSADELLDGIEALPAGRLLEAAAAQLEAR